jgi:hypothetical protein
MSRAYRIRVRESLKRVVRARDKVSTQLELLEVLPAGQMAELLAQELERRGFRRKGNQLVREQGGIAVSVDPESAAITVQTAAAKQVSVKGEREAWAFEEDRPPEADVRKELRKQLQQDLERQAKAHEAGLQTEVTAKLEASLGDLRRELDHTVNRVTAEALKQKAAQLGRIKELAEDPEAGSLTIVLEV